jgi:class 3 adenylate cyclase
MGLDQQEVGGLLATGRDAYERRAWQEAFQTLRTVDSFESLAAEDLARFAEAAWFAGDPDAALEARRRAHTVFLADEDPCSAALMAVHLASGYFDRGDVAVGSGWLSRAGRLLEDVDEPCIAHGWQALMQSAVAIGSGDPAEALAQAERIQEVAEQLGDTALQALGLEFEGMARVNLGEIDAGMALMDEATVSVATGELDPTCTGIIYCCTIATCRDLTDWERARQWTDEAERWCHDQGMSGFPGICRVHRAEILGFRGSWADAEREARRAADELARYDVMLRAEALYQVGELRLRVGDLTGAGQVFADVRELGRDPEPGTSLLRLASGDVAGANGGITRALEARTGLDRLRQLPAAVEIGVAAGELDRVRPLVVELEEVAQAMGKPALEASAGVARGRLALADGEPEQAAAPLRLAVERWRRVGSPYELAVARTLVGQALRAEEDEAAARLELEAARTAFERLGAVPDVRRVDALLGRDEGVATAAGERVARTFMFTDIVGSTTLAETVGDESWQELIRWHDKELRTHIEHNGGGEVRQTGDGFFVAFPDTSSAVEAAVAIQRGLAEHRRQHGFSPRVRIGLHRAEAAVRGRDFAGHGVHAAARIGALAAADEILVSRETVTDSPIRFPTSPPRTVTLKGVSEPVEVVSVGWR